MPALRSRVKQREAVAPVRRAVPVSHRGRWVAVAVLLVLLAMFGHTLFVNPRFEWGVVFHWFGAHQLLTGLERTLELTVIAMAIGIVIGVLLAVMRLSANPLVTGVAWFYVWLFRGTPLLVQLLFWGFISALYPRLSIGVPFGPEIAHFSANSVITPFVAGILGLGLNEGAYMSEIVRAGILSVDEGQSEAAAALGMRRMKIMRLIVLPQAMRVVIPPTGNETISMLKMTSLVSILAVPELLYASQLVYSVNYKTIPLLIAASLWYLIVTTILTIGQYYVERHFGRGATRNLPETPLQRLRRYLRAHVSPENTPPRLAEVSGR